MRKQLLHATAMLAIVCILDTRSAMAQDPTDAGVFLKTGTSSANALGNAYLAPFMKGFGQGLSDGWNNNTARPLGTGGFDIRFNLGMSQVPASDQTYQLDKVVQLNGPGSTYLVKQPGTKNEMPTISGPDDKGGLDLMLRAKSPITGNDTAFKVNGIPLPPGSGQPFAVSLPSVQLSIGIVKKTEIMLRFFPTTSFGSGSVGTWGFGIKHDIKQWIPVIKEQKIWDWSILAAYSAFNSEFNMGDKGLMPDPKDTTLFNPYPNVDFSNQKIVMSGSGFTVGTIVSAKLLFLTPYIGVNYSYSSFGLDFKGNYAVPLPNPEYNPVPGPNYNRYSKKIENSVDPLSLTGSMSNVRFNGGLRIKLAILVIGAEYSLGNYNTATLSVGLNLQSIKPFKL